MPIERRNNADVSVFSLGGTSYLCDLKNATLSVEIASQNASGVCDQWDYPWFTSKKWSITGDIFVNAAAALVTDAASGDALVTVSVNTGANAYTGTALITSISHNFNRDDLQSMSLTLEGQGALTVA